MKSRWNLSYVKQMFLYNSLEILFAVSTFPTLRKLSSIMKRTTVCFYETSGNSSAIRRTPCQNTQ